LLESIDINEVVPGELLISNATLQCADLDELCMSMLYTVSEVRDNFSADVPFDMSFVPGKIVSSSVSKGPAKADVMFIANAVTNRCKSGEFPITHEDMGTLQHMAKEAKLDTANWYITNFVKVIPPRGRNITAKYKKDALYYLAKEIQLVQPKLIVISGADVTNALFSTLGCRTGVLSKIRGRSDLYINGVPAVATSNLFTATLSPHNRDSLAKDMLIGAKRLMGEVKDDIVTDYKFIFTEDELNRLADDFIARDVLEIGLDCEWGSDTGKSDPFHGKLRCIQLSDAPGRAFVIVLRAAGLVDMFQPNVDAVVEPLRRILCRPGVALIGHSLRADAPWITNLGIDIYEQLNRGHDTMLMHHMRPPQEAYDLNTLIAKYTTMGRYDAELEVWLTNNGHNKAKLAACGYALIPDEILLPYAGADADALMRIYTVLKSELQAEKLTEWGGYDLPLYGRVETLYDLFRAIPQQVTAGIHTMEMTGVPMDAERLKELVFIYNAKREELVAQWMVNNNWPTRDDGSYIFSPRSVDHTKAYLFGPDILPKKKRVKFYAMLEEGAALNLERTGIATIPTTLGLKPVKSSEKHGREWHTISKKERSYLSPSTDAETLDILGAEDDRALKFKVLRLVDQVVKNFLRNPVVTIHEDGTETEEYTSGLLGCLDDNNRIHTTLGQLTDTGRYKCVDGDTLLDTSTGYVKIKDLVLNDDVDCLIKTHTGNWRRIVAKYYKGEEEMYDVVTEAGDYILCTAGHRLQTRTGWRDVKDLCVPDELLSIDAVDSAPSSGQGITQWRYSPIRRLVKVGVRDVWDISVEADESYVAQGLVHHNSRDPNLQNLPNKQEVLLKALFYTRELTKEEHGYKLEDMKLKGLINPYYNQIRTCIAAPPGHWLIEADYCAADLTALAFMAKCPSLITILTDPARDIHSETAVESFNLPCHYTEVKAKYKKQRIAAKAVIFGIVYGRSAGALVRALAVEGVTITVQEAQNIIDTFFKMHPEAKVYIDYTGSLVESRGFVETAYGRRRYFFPEGVANSRLAEMKRQGVNTPIQGTVADALSLSIINFDHWFRNVDNQSMRIRADLPVHDAIIFEIRADIDVYHELTQVVIPACMTQMVPLGAIRHTLQTDMSPPMTRWGVNVPEYAHLGS